MAFETNNGTRGNGNAGNESWRSQGFINVYLPARDGSRVKLGSIGLQTSKPREKELIEWLSVGTDEEKKAKLDALKGMLVLDYQSAEPSDAKGFALPTIGEEAAA